MTAATKAKIPLHLQRYIVDQDYSRYTFEDQAVWRYIMRQLKSYLSVHAHPSYLTGLEKTGISIEQIPSIARIDEHLEKIGWGAVPVSGFIPPAAFMEFQSLGILPIASDMRTVEHLLYTPAPDIVHEAAGHAPFLADPEYSAYLKMYGEVARHAIISAEDLAQYEAIRDLSDIKENPSSTPDDIRKAEKKLEQVNTEMTYVSEAALLSRMNWWTAEYGLIGSLNNPKIFGAGLLSSVGESRQCLEPKVKKIPLSVECVNYSYDITEPQPQLFVTESFAHLGQVLKELSTQMAYRKGGTFGLQRAQEAKTVNTVQLDSGLQISGMVSEFMTDASDQPTFVRLSGPAQLAYKTEELPGHSPQRHPQGFSSPIGLLKGQTRPLNLFTKIDLDGIGIQTGKKVQLEYESGIHLEGQLNKMDFKNGQLILLTFSDCRVKLGDRILFDPSWGEFDLAVGSRVVSVFGGPADRAAFIGNQDFVASRVPQKRYSMADQQRHSLYQEIRELRGAQPNANKFNELVDRFLALPSNHWLAGIELLEIAYRSRFSPSYTEPIHKRLTPENYAESHTREAILDGLELVEKIS